MKGFLLLAILLCACLLVVPNIPEADAIVKIVLPSDSIPMGIAFDGNRTVYVSLYWYGAIAEIDTISKNYKLYYLTSWHPEVAQNEIDPFALVFDGDGNLWISLRSSLGYHVGSPRPEGMVAKFNVTTKTFTYVQTNYENTKGIMYYRGYIWAAGTWSLFQIDPVNDTVVGVYYVSTIEWSVQYNGYIDCRPLFMSADGDFIWFSLYEWPTDFEVYGKLARFNISDRTSSIILEGFTHPMGIAVNSNFVYLAECLNEGYDGRIAKINKTSLVQEKLNVGGYYLDFDSRGNLWWTGTMRRSVGSITSSGSLLSWGTGISFFIEEVGNEVWYTELGSALIGVLNVNLPDLNNDGKVDIRDIAIVASAYGSYPGSESWMAIADLDGNSKIDIRDIARVARDYGKSWG